MAGKSPTMTTTAAVQTTTAIKNPTNIDFTFTGNSLGYRAAFIASNNERCVSVRAFIMFWNIIRFASLDDETASNCRTPRLWSDKCCKIMALSRPILFSSLSRPDWTPYFVAQFDASAPLGGGAGK